jgi:hypothetical protein
MSADPATLALISAFASGVGTYSSIQAEKARSKAQIAEYERQRQLNELNALQEENRRREQAERDKSNNMALFASSGFDPSSRSFLTINDEVDRIAAKDIANIRLNKLSTTSALNTATYLDKAKSSAKVTGGYMSIISTGAKGYGNYQIYKNPKSTTVKTYPMNNPEDDI